MEWTKFGWAGITLEVPVNWELGGLSGDDKEGYLRLDDDEIPRLELKWAQSKKKKPDLGRVLDEYFKLVRKNYKRKEAKLHIQRHVSLTKEQSVLEGREVVSFTWKGDIRANGIIFHCQTCKRITIVQIMGHLKENLRASTIRILQSVQDHPVSEDVLWSAYRLSVEVPQRYRLGKRQLLSGYLLFSFADGSRKISIERYGVADVTLKEHDLESWFRVKYAKAIRGYGFQIASEVYEGDKRIKVIGAQTRMTDRVPLAAVLAVDKVLRRQVFAAHLWRCHYSNRIYVVQAVAKRDASKIASRVSASIKCH